MSQHINTVRINLRQFLRPSNNSHSIIYTFCIIIDIPTFRHTRCTIYLRTFIITNRCNATFRQSPSQITERFIRTNSFITILRTGTMHKDYDRSLFLSYRQRQRSGQFKVICSHRYISFLHFLFIISYRFCCRSSRYRHQTNGIHASISIERQQKTETVTLKLQIAIIKCYAFSTLLLPLSFCLKFSELLFRLLKHVLKNFR